MSKKGCHLQYRKPGWAVFWIAILFLVTLGQSKAFSHMAKKPEYQPVPAWQYTHQPEEGETQYLPREYWDKTIDWHSIGYSGKKPDSSQHFEITAIARKDGKELARFLCEYKMESHWVNPVLFHLEDRSFQVNPDYAIRSTVHMGRHGISMELALVSTKHDHSSNVVFLRNENVSGSSSTWQATYPLCPSLKFGVSPVMYEDEEKRYTRYVAAGGVVQLPAPNGMFPGTDQPIDWTLYVQRLDEPDWIEEYHIPAGERETPEQRERIEKRRKKMSSDEFKTQMPVVHVQTGNHLKNG
jgi:hypothetical protein